MDLSILKEAFPASDIKLNEPLSNYSYTKTGGQADALVFPQSVEETQALVTYIKEQDWPLTVLGNASNLIIRDGGIRGVTLMMTSMKGVRIDGEILTAQSGARLIDVCQVALSEHLTGLEFACGIPGSIGGAVYMNAGAYGGEVKDVIASVTMLTADGEIVERSNEEMDFAYRQSYVQASDDIVLEVVFQLEKGEYPLIEAKMMELTELREAKQPLDLPSCGSVFKRPEGYYTGKLIQDAGLQGVTIGGAQVSEKHAGFIVNIGGGTAADYMQLIEHIQEQIWKIYKVKLEREVRIIGDDTVD